MTDVNIELNKIYLNGFKDGTQKCCDILLKAYGEVGDDIDWVQCILKAQNEFSKMSVEDIAKSQQEAKKD